MGQGLEHMDISVNCGSLIKELCARRDGGGGRSISISGLCCKDHSLEGEADSVDPIILAFLGAAIFYKVVKLLEDCHLLAHVGGELTKSLSVVDLWFFVGGNDSMDSASRISLDLTMMMGLMDEAA